MGTEAWDRERATGVVDPLVLDDLAGECLVLDGVGAADDDRLSWCRSAPCVVVGTFAPGSAQSDSVDIALPTTDVALIEELRACVNANPQACAVLVDVLRAVPHLDVPSGLRLESLAYSTLQGGAEFARWMSTRPAPRPRDFDGPPVRLDRDGSRLRVSLARPENRNAFSAAMRDALVEALSVAEMDDSVKEVVVDADGPVFSSGGDLAEFGAAPDPAMAHEVRVRRSVGAVLARIAATVTVRVHGECVGAGVELPAFAHRVVAAADTTFRLPEISMGLIPGAGGTVGITRRIGRQHMARLAILGRSIDVTEALSLGLVDEVDGADA